VLSLRREHSRARAMITRTGAAADLQKRTGSLATVLLARTALGVLDRHREKNCETPKSSKSRFDGSQQNPAFSAPSSTTSAR